MKPVQIFTWIIAPLIIASLIAAFSMLMLKIYRREQALVEAGMRDKEIIKQKRNITKKSTNRLIFTIIEYLLLGVVATGFLLGAISALKHNEFKAFGKNVKICVSDSMAKVHPTNSEYASLGGQGIFKVDDILFIEKLPAEKDIKLYDIVTYKDPSTKHTIVHRIIDIKEISGKLHYTLRGDANSASDNYLVTYDEFTGIYRGNKWSGAGIFVRFVQSPFGLISFLVCAYICVLEDILSRKLGRADLKRLAIIESGYKDSYIRIGEDGFAINVITQSELELESYPMEKVNGCLVPVLSKLEFTYSDVFEYLKNLPEVSFKNSTGKRPSNFKVNSKTFAMLYAEEGGGIKMTFKSGSTYGSLLSKNYPEIKKSSFPYGILWFTVTKGENIGLEMFKLLADISYRISKSGY